MILYANGDSHTAGVGVDHRQTFANLVARHFGLTLVNHAQSGASNQRILRTTRDYLSNNDPALILIGWSTWEREEWLYQDNYYDVNSSGHPGLPEELHDRYKQWVTEQTADVVDTKSQQAHSDIYQLHTDLAQHSTGHLFFNCMYNFFKISEPVDWQDNYVGPYDNEYSYYWYLKNHGWKTDAWYHYSAEAHAVWADVLIKHIEESNLL
jgi:hypothetical protein